MWLVLSGRNDRALWSVPRLRGALQLWDPIERVGKKEFLFGVTAKQVGGLVAQVSNDGIAEPLYLDANRRLETDRGSEMGAVWHHKKPRIVSQTNRAQISLGSGTLRFRPARDENDSDICTPGRKEN